MYEHNAFGYRSGLALCLTKVRSSRARCPATALITAVLFITPHFIKQQKKINKTSTPYGKKTNIEDPLHICCC